MVEAIKIIEKKVLSSLSNDKKNAFINWFKLIQDENDLEDLRLIVNIAIDIKHKLLDLKLYKDIFNSIDLDFTSNFRFKFENAIKENGFHTFSNYYSNPNEKYRFVRVLNVPTLIQYCINKSDDIHDIITAKKMDRALLKMDSILKHKKISFELSGMRPRQISWVQPLSDFNNMMNEIVDQDINPAEIICSCTGLLPSSDENRKHLGYIIYPKNFSEKTYQPCSVNVNWYNENIFLSYKKNNENFGRCRTTIDDSPDRRRKERIHDKVAQNPKYKYEIKYIGKINNVEINTDRIVAEALKRL